MPIVAAVLGELAGVIGAAALARDAVEGTRVKIGLTLPSFVTDPEVPVAVARAAEDAGLDGVFVYDHLFRRAPSGARRPALEGTTLLAAVAAATTRIGVGGLVFRATLRPPATLAAVLDSVRRVAGPRLLPTLGSGDHESREENETFGLGFGTMADRVAALRAAVLATPRPRLPGLGGRDQRGGALARGRGRRRLEPVGRRRQPLHGRGRRAAIALSGATGSRSRGAACSCSVPTTTPRPRRRRS